MSDLFSHAPEPRAGTSGPLPPLEISVDVPVSPEDAFRGWTEHIHLWWPVAEFSVTGEDAHVDFEGGELIETSAGDQMVGWGTVLAWEPASLLSFTWHPGGTALQATEVEIRFVGLQEPGAAAAATRVGLTHTGWDNLPDAASDRAEYERGWPEVLNRFVRFMGGLPGG